MILDGKKIAEEMLAEVAEEVKIFRQAQGKPPRLAAVLVENTHLAVGPPSGVRRFLELKKKAAEKVGIDFRLYEFPADITTQKLRKEIVGIAKAGVNRGVLVELPLPEHINVQYALNAIPPEKDVDVLSEKSQGSFFAGRLLVLPPAVEAVKIILEKHSIELQGKNCVVFGYGPLVGKPVSHWLASQGATVSIINEFTLHSTPYTLNADIIISGVGPVRSRARDGVVSPEDHGAATSNGASKPLITADMTKEGSVIIDFAKDVDFEAVSKKAGLITPPVGGVGPIVVAAVLKNLLTLYKK